MASDPRSYTTVAVAKRLGVSLQTVQRWVDAGHLKAWKTMGGHRRIEAQSAEAMFKAQEEVIGAQPVAPASASAGATSVLVVDDDPMALELLTLLVQEALPAARIASAHNGFQALWLIGRATPDIVVTDLEMPYMDGLAMLRHLIDEKLLGPGRLIAVTALSPAEVAALGTMPAGVPLFMKPVERERFLQALRVAAH